MSAVPLNLTIEQGTDFEIELTVRNTDSSPLNLLSYTGASLVKKHYEATTSYPFTFIFLDRINGRIALTMTANQTNSLNEGRYVYDVVLTSPNNLKTRVVQGTVLVSPGVS